MRIVWNDIEKWFQAEISLALEHWRDDVDHVKAAGFRTDGPPQWIWHTAKASTLNKLRKNPPKSGLAITELALLQYTTLNKQELEKEEFRRKFKKAAQEISSCHWKEYIDPDTGITCKVVEPADKPFTWKYTPPPFPEAYCFICGSPVFDYEGTDLCMWCAQNF